MQFETFDALLEKLGTLKNALGATERTANERSGSVGWLIWNERAPTHIHVWVVSSLLGTEIHYERVYVFDRDSRSASCGHRQAVTAMPRLESEIGTWEAGFQRLVSFLDEHLGKKHDQHSLAAEENVASRVLEQKYLKAIRRLRIESGRAQFADAVEQSG